MKRSLGFLLVQVCFANLSTICLAQSVKLPYHQRIDLVKGLPSDVIYEMNQSKKGTLWLASEKGLFSYNGSSYSSYQIEKSNFYSNDIINVKIDYLNRPIALDFTKYLFLIDDNTIVSRQIDPNVPKLDNYNLKVINYSDRSMITDGTSIYSLVGNTFKREYTISPPIPSGITDFDKSPNNALKLLYQNGLELIYNPLQKTVVNELKYQNCFYSQTFEGNFVGLTKQEVLLQFNGSSHTFPIPSEINANNIYRHTFIAKYGTKVYGLYSSHMFIIDLNVNQPKLTWYYVSDASTLSTLVVTTDGTIFISTLGDGLYRINSEWLNTRHITYNTNSKILNYTNLNNEDIAYQKRRIYFYKNNKLQRSVPVKDDVLIYNITYLDNFYYAAGSRYLFKIPPDVFRNLSEFSYSTLHNYTFSDQDTKDMEVFNNQLYFTTSTHLVKYDPLTNSLDTLLRQRCEKMFVQCNLLFVNTEDYLRVYNSNAKNILNLNLKAQSITDYKDSNSMIILSKTNDLYLLTLNDEKLTPIKSKIDKNLDDILWYKNYLYVCNSTGILKLHYFEHNKTTSITSRYDFEHYDMQLINQDGKFILNSNRGVMEVPVNSIFRTKSFPNYLAIESSNGILKNNTVFLDKSINHLTFNVVDQSLSCIRYCAIIDNDTTFFNTSNIQLGKLSEGKSTINIIGYDRFNSPSKTLVVSVKNDVPIFKSDFFRYVLLGTVATLLLLIAFATYRNRLKLLKVESNSKTKEMETRLVALRSQMNPHFIYNVLNTAQSHMFSNNLKQANEIINKLSHIIRKVLESTKSRYIELGDEIKLISEYCDLERARYDNKFNFEIQVDPKLVTNLKIPYFFVQPLVENAIWHGLIKDVKNKDRRLVVSFFQKDAEVKITVDDNGIGFDSEKLREGSVALKNLKERIEIKKQLRKIDTTLTITNKKWLNTNEKGTICELTIKMPDFL